MDTGVWVLREGLGSTGRCKKWDPGEGREECKREGAQAWERAGGSRPEEEPAVTPVPPCRLGRELVQPSLLHPHSEFIFHLPLPTSPHFHPQSHAADRTMIAVVCLEMQMRISGSFLSWVVLLYLIYWPLERTISKNPDSSTSALNAGSLQRQLPHSVMT